MKLGEIFLFGISDLPEWAHLLIKFSVFTVICLIGLLLGGWCVTQCKKKFQEGELSYREYKETFRAIGCFGLMIIVMWIMALLVTLGQLVSELFGFE